jgi:tRNA dimethylallyltransferase
VGKSEIAIALAAEMNGAIVNADSKQVYRYLDIGTGKPSKAERERAAHFMIDVFDPDDEFNAALYRRLASEHIEQIHRHEQNAIVCGGTGLYLKALTRGLFDGPGQNGEMRQALEQRIEREGLEALYRELLQIDPSVAATIHPNDRLRTMRALEVYQATGKRLSDWQKDHAFHEQPFDVLKIGLNRERGELYGLINCRSERMVAAGFLDEVRGLVIKGYSLSLKPLLSVGYRQMGQVVQGQQDLPDALEEMKQETRRLAKRQLTWFRADQEVHWFHPEQRSEIIEAAKRFLSN